MPLLLDRPGVACTVAVSLVAATAALFPATGRADDPLTAVDPAAPLAGTTSVASDAIASTAPELAPVVEELTGAGATTAPTPLPDDASTAEPEPVPAPGAEPAPTEQTPEPALDAASTGDTTPVVGDIATDTPAATPEPVEPPAPAAPVKADTPSTVTANVNVSVRIASPGDNGAVTQLNLARTGATAGGGSATTDRADAPDPSPTRLPDTTSSTAQNPDRTASGAWYWNWDCLGATSGGTISPSLPEGVSFPSSWTWNWNCADNSSKYQSETPSRYQQVNANISIRISSPGNDGPVSQVNVGAALAVSLPEPVRGLPAPAGSAPLPASVTAVLGAVLEPSTAVLAPVSGDTTATDSTVISEIVPAATVVVAPPTFDAAATAVAMPAAGLPAGPWGGAWWSVLPAGRPATGRPASGRPTTSVMSAWRSAASPARPAVRAATAEARAAAPSPHRRIPLPGRVPIVATSGASASAGGAGGGSSGSGIPALLLLPFVAVLLDLARRVALEHAALPSGHRRRVPDRPG